MISRESTNWADIFSFFSLLFVEGSSFPHESKQKIMFIKNGSVPIVIIRPLERLSPPFSMITFVQVWKPHHFNVSGSSHLSTPHRTCISMVGVAPTGGISSSTQPQVSSLPSHRQISVRLWIFFLAWTLSYTWAFFPHPARSIVICVSVDTALPRRLLSISECYWCRKLSD